MNRSQNKRAGPRAAGQIEQLLREARKQPGVSELFDVYQIWRQIDMAIQPHRFFMGQQFTVSASNSSEFE